MEIKYTDLEDEIRDGFYVDSLMKCCWMAQLKVLEHIDRICQKHNIQYQAEFGTLLGTIRHGGFIPWDDDMDISMKRADYNRFLKIAEAELPEGYHVMSYRKDDDYWDVMARVVNSKIMRFDKDFLDENANFPFSTGIDIFPMDFIPTNEGEINILRDLIDDVKNTADAYGAGVLEGEELEKRLQILEKLCNMKIERTGDLRQRLYDIVVSLYSLYHEEESKEIALMPLWLENGNNVFPKEYYAKTARLPFDKFHICVPIAYDSILKQKYGNYMKMLRKGGGHDYPYYNKQIKILEECGYTFPRFEFKERTLRKEKKAEDEKVNLGMEQILVLENAHISLGKLLLMQDRETAMGLLVKCQECVLALGERIEKEVADCESLIVSLENYCEWIFQIYQVLQSGEDANAEAVMQILKEQMNLIKEEFGKGYKYKKKVVFIIDKLSRWDSLRRIWKKEKEDRNTIVKVIAAPYFYRRMDGEILEEHYEKDSFPSEVEVIDWQAIDLEQYHPDVIYINTPYDEYNYFSSIHPYFYSSNLVSVCEQLVYVPWFTLTELTREDERGWMSMKHFVTMPGVVNADKVFVQSEQMKKAYIDYLMDWAGEETRAIWEEKIHEIDREFADAENLTKISEKNMPEEWKKHIYKEDGSKKKILLYAINSGSFIDYKEKAVCKLKKVLEIFKEYKEQICVIWYWDTAMEETFKTNYPELWKGYQDMVGRYKEEDWGIYTEDKSFEPMASFSDAYYGDGCKISQEMIVAKKPVMLQNFDC